ncbi:MAG: HAMP domain-containing histidine kinase [Oscillospiraceae bacterium]|nr:HAMP domain-containing histidine kinase [Oscillospiraceae bacterium]
MIIGKSKKMVAEMSESIDKIIHGDDSMDIQLFQEGELYILQNQINKMTVRLREQNDTLKKDKVYLADSLADIAHQLRTPMTSLNLLLSFLPPCEHTREAEQLLARMDWLLTALLKISKIDAGTAVFRAQEVDNETLIQKTLDALAVLLELRGITVNVQCVGRVCCDVDWTAEAIGNVLKNCMEYSPRIDIDCTQNHIYTEIVIRDYGVGIAPEDLPHIFERFYQGKARKNDGYGIGLALCRMVLSEQNATIKAVNRIENGEVAGVTFTMRFYSSSTYAKVTIL